MMRPGGEVVVVEPRPGTLDWLQLQPTVEVQGTMLPACHRVPEDAVLVEADGRRCRVERSPGDRCGATPTRRYGVCLAHAGGGGWRDSDDARRLSRMGNARRAVLRERRAVLGIGSRRN